MSNNQKQMKSNARVYFIALLFFALFMALSIEAQAQPPINIKAVEKILPSTTIKEAFYTEIPGLLGVLLDSDIVIYVYTPKEIIFFGELYTKDGVNLTTEKHAPSVGGDSQENQASGISQIELSPLMEAAAKVNSSNSEYGFIVFTDPDCPYCQHLEEFLLSKNVDIYNVYTPLDSIHPKAREKSIKLLQKYNNIDEQKARELLEKGEAIAHAIGVHATPITIVFKTSTNIAVTGVNGADIEKIKKYIGNEK